MRLGEDKIVKIITDYINDSKEKHALLIDGSWGVGKTYFIKKKLIDGWSNKDLPILYISLYGMDDILEVEKEIYRIIFINMLGKTTGVTFLGKKRKIVNILSKFGSVGLKFMNINFEDFLTIKELKDIEKIAIIFDDLERCNIDIDIILGFINNLVEHKEVKAILIGNEKEIGIEEESKKKFYKKVKEKLVAYTLYYEPDFYSVYDSIVESYDESKDFFEKNKDFIIKIFIENEHYNLRTLKFALHSYHKILKVLDSIEFDFKKYIEEEKKSVLEYLLKSAIQLKSGKKIYLVKGPHDVGSIYKDGNVKNISTTRYKFVDSLLQYGYIDEENIKNVISTRINRLLKIDRDHKERNDLVLFKLNRWWELEDNDIMEYLNQLKNELELNKYFIIDFPRIINSLIEMKKYGFDEIEIKEYVKLIKEYLLNAGDITAGELLKVFDLDSETNSEYNSIVSDFADVINEKDKHNHWFDNNQIFGKDLDSSFIEFCIKNKNEFLFGEKFIYYFDINVVLERMKTWKVKEIYDFRSGLESVYSFSNINECFKDDIYNLKKLIRGMDIEDLSKNSRTKKIALENLKKWLEEKLKILEF